MIVFIIFLISLFSMNILFYRYNLSRKLDNSLILSDVNNNNNRCNNITNINDNNNIKIININNIYYILDITNDKIIPTSFQELEKYNTTINKNIVKIDNNYFEIDIKNNKVYNIDLVSEILSQNGSNHIIDNHTIDNKQDTKEEFKKYTYLNDTDTSNGENLIILVGLPKSGTQSMDTSLSLLNIKSVHWILSGSDTKLCENIYPVKNVTVGGYLNPRVTLPQITQPLNHCYVGLLMQNDLSKGLPPLQSMINIGIRSFMQMDFIFVNSNRSVSMFPQFEMLDELIKYYPKANYIHTRRELTETHVASMKNWWGMADRLNTTGYLNKFEGQSPSKTIDENCKIFIEKVTEITLNAFKKRPDVKLLDLCIDCKNVNVNEVVKNFLELEKFEFLHENNRHGSKISPPAHNSNSNVLMLIFGIIMLIFFSLAVYFTWKKMVSDSRYEGYTSVQVKEVEVVESSIGQIESEK